MSAMNEMKFLQTQTVYQNQLPFLENSLWIDKEYCPFYLPQPHTNPLSLGKRLSRVTEIPKSLIVANSMHVLMPAKQENV